MINWGGQCVIPNNCLFNWLLSSFYPDLLDFLVQVVRTKLSSLPQSCAHQQTHGLLVLYINDKKLPLTLNGGGCASGVSKSLVTLTASMSIPVKISLDPKRRWGQTRLKNTDKCISRQLNTNANTTIFRLSNTFKKKLLNVYLFCDIHALIMLPTIIYFVTFAACNNIIVMPYPSMLVNYCKVASFDHTSSQPLLSMNTTRVTIAMVTFVSMLCHATCRAYLTYI